MADKNYIDSKFALGSSFNTSKRTLKQQLASEYNFLIFRTYGGYLSEPSRRKIPTELSLAIYEANKARKRVIKVLRQPQTREKFMNLNQEEK